MAIVSIDDVNLFAYCANNPVSREDEDGELWTLVLRACIGAASIYVGDVISNHMEGKTGIDMFTPTSSLGTYLGAAVSEMIPGSKVVASVARVVVNTTVKNTVDYLNKSQKVTFQRVANDVGDGACVESATSVTNKILTKISPKNYSSFRHNVSRFFPKMTRQTTASVMHGWNRFLLRTGKLMGFAYSVASSVR